MFSIISGHVKNVEQEKALLIVLISVIIMITISSAKTISFGNLKRMTYNHEIKGLTYVYSKYSEERNSRNFLYEEYIRIGRNILPRK